MADSPMPQLAPHVASTVPPVAPVPVAAPPPAPPVRAISDIHRAYLNALYATEFYRELHRRSARFALHLDFAIALGAASSGGSGFIGSLNKDPTFAWICGPLAVLSVFLSVAKSIYKWTEKLKHFSDAIAHYSKVAGRLRALVEDMNRREQWDDEFHTRYAKIREDSDAFTDEPYDDLPKETQTKIQDGIKAHYNYKTWW